MIIYHRDCLCTCFSTKAKTCPSLDVQEPSFRMSFPSIHPANGRFQPPERMSRFCIKGWVRDKLLQSTNQGQAFQDSALGGAIPTNKKKWRYLTMSIQIIYVPKLAEYPPAKEIDEHDHGASKIDTYKKQ